MNLPAIKSELDKKGFYTRITDDSLIAGINPETNPDTKIITIQSTFGIEIVHDQVQLNYFSGQIAKTEVFGSIQDLLDFIGKNHPFS